MSRPRKSHSGIWRDAVRDSELDRTAKLVGLVLSTYLNRELRAWPARQTIADGGSITPRAVDNALARLKSAGFLEIYRTKGGNGRTNTYAALLPPTANAVHRSEWANGERHDPNGERHAPNGERRSHESVESVERTRAARLEGGRAALVEDDCMACSKRLPLLDDRGRLLCQECIVAEARDLADALRDHVAGLRQEVAPR